MDDEELKAELIDTWNEINRQIRMLKLNADEMHVPYYELKNGRGEYLINSLLVAKAEVIYGLALLRRS